MCGITGFWSFDRSAADPEAQLRQMAAALRHRGPDDEGVWWDPTTGVGLAFRRLAILDLSPTGRQPMTSASGRYVIVFNGETYNFLDLRRELEQRGVAFRGGSDTEVMLAEIECRGVVEAVKRFAGMFAFAVFDRQARTLSLVRDRIGEKPLYYGWAGRTLLFGSELKALRAHPAWRGEIDRDALAQFLRYNYVPAPRSIYRGFHKVLPGTVLTFAAGAPGADPHETAYWSARDMAEQSMAAPLRGTDDELTEQLDALLRPVVRREMVADVPLGAFLSGGIDSSLIVALMQAQSGRPVRTFTIGFHERTHNEAEHAKAVARHLHTDHTELYITPAETLALVPKLAELWDEPFADSSQIPTYLVSALARRYVTVSLSGDGGDELFGGYYRYFLGERLEKWINPVPRGVRRGAARLIRAFSPGAWDRGVGWMTRWAPRSLPWSVTGDRLHKLADVLECDTDRDMYRHLVSHWQDPAAVVRDAREQPGIFNARDQQAQVGGLPWMMYMDLVTYLPDDILVKMDRASMGVSLESRAPYLHHHVVEFAWRLPIDAKVRGGMGKRILRNVLYRYVPRELLDRPKMGFGIPLDGWLRGPLREWAAGLLDEERLRREGYFDVDQVTRKWTEHQSSVRNWQYRLWGVLMFQAWLEAQ